MKPRKIPETSVLKKMPKQALKKAPKRHVDRDYYAFTHWNVDIDVRCPHCQKRGVVTNQSFTCHHCAKREKITLKTTYKVDEICTHCQRHFRIEITDVLQQRLKMLHIQCPHCHTMQNAVIKTSSDRNRGFSYMCHPHQKNGKARLQAGQEPTFGLPFYYQTALQGRVLWAFNREHLLYLIDYLEADLRERPHGFGGEFQGMMRQSDHIPKFFKITRHRKTLVKRLKDLLNFL
jgi:endogenous inhibitor of DNA gyrase (YacG/DUF329 family)